MGPKALARGHAISVPLTPAQTVTFTVDPSYLVRRRATSDLGRLVGVATFARGGCVAVGERCIRKGTDGNELVRAGEALGMLSTPLRIF
ncbi:hypothetical protein BHM03_00016396 [Ensete ventricosum]|nr:hypothetical protein BHM03_00016396 [Ensete ventricosum]